MSWIDRANAKFGRYAVPNVTLFLIVGQVLAFIANSLPGAEDGPQLVENIMFVPGRVVQGEWWLVITYLFTPPLTHPVFAFFFWYFFYLMGTTLEFEWGAFRYNIYLLLGYLASVAMAFVVYFSGGTLAGEVGSNAFLYGSVFLAFARLYPDFLIYVMFVLPVKVRWIALLTWISYAVTMLFSPSWLERGMVVAAVFNYLVFFGRDIVRNAKHGHRRMQFQAKSLQGRGGKRRRMQHECRVCGLSSKDSPKTAFRYCSECGGDYCYCPEHLTNHEHVKAEDAAS